MGDTGGLRLRVESAAVVVIVLRLVTSVPANSPGFLKLEDDLSLFMYALWRPLLYLLWRQHDESAYKQVSFILNSNSSI